MSKRLLSMLLAICLVFSCVLPVASAVEAPADSYVNTDETTAKNTDTKKTAAANGLVASNDAAGAHTMRDTLTPKLEAQSANGDGKWVATLVDKIGENLLTTETPSALEELKKKPASCCRSFRISCWE